MKITKKIAFYSTLIGSLILNNESLAKESGLEKKVVGIDEPFTQVEIYSQKKINPGEKNALVILTRGFGNYVMGYDEETKEFNKSIKKIQDNFNTYVALVDHPSDFVKAHELAEEKLGKLDLIYIDGHGLPTSIMLSENFSFSSKDLVKEDLSRFYNAKARGIIGACLTADPRVKDNFAQSLSNSANIPIEGAKTPVQGYITDDFHLEEAWSKVKGFNSKNNNTGNFESNDGRVYGITKKNNGTYKVISFTSFGENDKGKFELPWDFDSAKVWYYDTEKPTRESFRTVHPNREEQKATQ